MNDDPSVSPPPYAVEAEKAPDSSGPLSLPALHRQMPRMSDREQDDWIDTMRNRYGGEW